MAIILVVDDHSANRKILITLLGHYGHRMLEAKDGVDGLSVVQSEKPDLIIADILMPTMNGFELVRRLRQDPKTALISVIFYSATFLEGETLAVARACGVFKVLAKPSDLKEVLRVVNEALASPMREPPYALPHEEAGIEVVQVLNNKLYAKNEELLELTAQLEQRVAERTSELENANRRLQEQMVEREIAELRLRQVQRLDALGMLAGGVAHDFNNLLTVILGQSEILVDRSREEVSIHCAEMIKESAERGAALTRQLLAFGRRQVLEPRVLDLNIILADVEKLLRRVIGEDIELDFQTEAKLDCVDADPGQVEQVILNLAINARDAMPHGGKLRFTTANVRMDESNVDRHTVMPPGPYVQLVVSDTGYGMDEKTQARLFEPFFTTKEAGKGTGLGLATVYGIVKQSGGYIWVYSELGHGTAFKIYLPMVGARAEMRPRVEKTGPTPLGSETILLVEDDDGVREVACLFLKSSGYKVIEAALPREALRVAEEHDGPIDFLMTDLIMPGMNGRQLAAQLTAKYPQMKVLFVSGYTNGVVKDGVYGVLEEGLEFLQKPYTRYALTRKIREILDSSRVKTVTPSR
jgi:signal transduction histidine kinase